MANTTKDTLFELIKCLNKSEKRYIKIFLCKHIQDENSTSKILFDFIEKMDYYDETIIIENFKKSPLINKFSITKKRLYNHVLTALDQFHARNLIEAQIYKQLNASEILYQKSLYDQAEKILNSIEKIAQKNELTALLLQISTKKKKIYENKCLLSNEFLGQIIQNDEKLMYINDIKNKLWTIKTKLFNLLAVHGRKSDNILKSEFEASLFYIQKIQSEVHLNFKEETEILFLINHTLSAYYFALNELEESKVYLEHNLDLFENNPNLKRNKINQYLSLLNNISFIYSLENSLDKLSLIRKKIALIQEEAKEQNNEDLQIKSFISSACLTLNYLQENDFLSSDDKTESLQEVERGLKCYNNKIVPQRKAYFLLKIAINYINKSNYKEALKNIHLIFQNREFDSFSEINEVAHLLNILILIESKDYFWAEQAIKNAQKHIQIKTEFVVLFLKYAHKINKCENQINEIEIWEEFYSKMICLVNSGQKKIELEYFNFVEWLKNKAKILPAKNYL